jgi:dTMP kinase
MRRGKFIVIEGGDGAGKDTQIDLLREKFADRDIIFTRDPGGTDISFKIRTLIKENNMSPKTEFLLFLASRAQLVDEVIVPALEEGRYVICHRFALSTIAYQIYGRERLEYFDMFKTMSDFAWLKPDFTVLLDVTPEVGLERIKQREKALDRFEKEELAFHKRVREGYRKHVADFGNYVVIDADQSVKDVHGKVLDSLEKVLGT